MTKAPKNLHLISDSTGDTIQVVARSAIARFANVEPRIHVSVFVRNDQDLGNAVARIREHPGLVIHTLADPIRLKSGRKPAQAFTLARREGVCSLGRVVEQREDPRMGDGGIERE